MALQEQTTTSSGRSASPSAPVSFTNASAFVPPHLGGQVQESLEKVTSKLSLGTMDKTCGNRQRANMEVADIKPRNAPLSFLDLPGEIRNKSYRYALATNHNKPQWYPKDANESYGYCLTPNLLQVNRQVNEEATSIFYEENRFVLIGTTNSLVFDAIRGQRLPVVATTSKAGLCPKMTMTIEFEDLGSIKEWTSCTPKSSQFVIAAQDLETFALVWYEIWTKEDEDVLLGNPRLGLECGVEEHALRLRLLNTFGLSNEMINRELLRPLDLLRDIHVLAPAAISKKHFKN